MKSRLNRLHKTGLSNKAIAEKLNISANKIKDMNHNDIKLLNLIKDYNKKIADK